MNLPFISDSTGKTTEDWNELRDKFKGIEQEEIDIPQWQKDMVPQRIISYDKNPGQALDFDIAMDDIETGL